MKTPFNSMLFGFLLATCSIQSFGLSLNGTIRVPDERIVGVEPAAQEGEIPYHLRLLINGQVLCGGSLISVENKQAVITAAQCVTRAPFRIEIFGGSIYISGVGNNTQHRRATKIVTRDYRRATEGNDIAILALDQPFELNKFVNIVKLPRRMQLTTGVVVASGWCHIRQNGAISLRLQKVDLRVISNDECRKAYSPLLQIGQSMMCAVELETGRICPCHGNAGGPLRAKTGNYLAGVALISRGCDDGRYPRVYNRVSHFVDWIERTVRSF